MDGIMVFTPIQHWGNLRGERQEWGLLAGEARQQPPHLAPYHGNS
jgi:hypothetical protein